MAKIVTLGDDYLVAGNIVPVVFDSGDMFVILVPIEIAHSHEEAAQMVAVTLNRLAKSGERVTIETVHAHHIGDGNSQATVVTTDHDHGPEPGSGN
jgi:hypothetical protein